MREGDVRDSERVTSGDVEGTKPDDGECRSDDEHEMRRRQERIGEKGMAARASLNNKFRGEFCDRIRLRAFAADSISPVILLPSLRGQYRLIFRKKNSK